MHRQSPRWGQHRFRVALIALHLVVDPQFLEQPQYPLRPRVVQVVHGDHGGIVGHSSAVNTHARLEQIPGDQPFSPGGNQSTLTERNSGCVSQRAAIAASAGYATAVRLIASASTKKVYTHVAVMSGCAMRLPINHSPARAWAKRSSSASAACI